MQRQQVKSSNIASIGYDQSLFILEIEFLNGEIYQYINVPDNIFQGIMSASSHGTYLNQYIKDRYNFNKIK